RELIDARAAEVERGHPYCEEADQESAHGARAPALSRQRGVQQHRGHQHRDHGREVEGRDSACDVVRDVNRQENQRKQRRHGEESAGGHVRLGWSVPHIASPYDASSRERMTIPSQAASNVSGNVISPTTTELVMMRPPPPPAISNGTVCFVGTLNSPSQPPTNESRNRNLAVPVCQVKTWGHGARETSIRYRRVAPVDRLVS